MKTIIIAEAGVNHNGCLETAIEMVNQASYSKADFIKFQYFNASELVIPTETKANYQKKNTDNNETQYEMLKRLELRESDFIKLSKHCAQKNIRFLCSPFSISSADFLYSINSSFVKISSGNITDRPLLETISKKNWNIIFSIGMSSITEIDDAFKILSKSGKSKKKLSILLCTSQYPTPFNDVHLRAMKSLRERYGVKVGLSDHTVGIHIPIAAVALGATLIEKHFTLDKNMSGPDHKASIDSEQLKNMVSQIRDVEKSLGISDIGPRKSEKENLPKARKSIVALNEIKIGDIFSSKNLTTMRPGYGISPMKIYELIGLIAKKTYKKNDLIDISELEDHSNE